MSADAARLTQAGPGTSHPEPAAAVRADVGLRSVPDLAPEDAEDAAAVEEDEERDPAELDQEDPAVLATWELVHAAQAGDAEAFGRLYDRYVDTVFRYVLFRVRDRPLAEDLTSETFVRALRRITTVSYQGKDVGAWFTTIARNLVLDHVKSSRHRLEVTTAEPRDSGSLDDPESEVVAGAVNAELLRCVSQLGDDQRECIALRFLQGLSVAETAVLMGRNEGAVKALQHRAVRRLATLVPDDLR